MFKKYREKLNEHTAKSDLYFLPVNLPSNVAVLADSGHGNAVCRHIT